ncbi:flagellar biosynthetic protein FliR [Undibacterium sp. TJN25]|uniref:flagellar biosynthetic protein FliR n=1 Tax=Undibacterium sp. TJN25 TaxID=3413056 RepID=UPI003BF19351
MDAEAFARVLCESHQQYSLVLLADSHPMILDIDPTWAVAVFLLSLRIGVLLMSTPVFADLAGAVTVRVLFTLALSVVLVSGLRIQPLHSPLSLGALIIASLLEISVGVTLAFGVSAAFGAFAVAGKILDVQSGFGIGSVFDPVTRAESPLFAMMLNMLSVTAFFSLDGHHALLRGIAFSAQQIAPGAGFSELSLEPVIRQFGLMFSLGTALIAPVMFCLFLVEAAFAMMSRVLPQMNVFVVSVPAKIFVALVMFALTIGSLGAAMNRVYASIFNYWEQVLS